ncbi:MAG: hydroxylamine reductase [Elusimicrobiota bacterium]
MFCYQCEQRTRNGAGCIQFSNCGKDAQTGVLMDLLGHACMGLSQYAHRARKLGAKDRELDVFVVESLFTTVTNVNFDADRIETWVRKAAQLKARARSLYEEAARKAGIAPETLSGPAAWTPALGRSDLLLQGPDAGIQRRIKLYGPDVSGLQELVKYGLKGLCAYAEHARVLGVEEESVYAFTHEALDFLADEPKDVAALTAMALRAGEVNLTVMEMLDRANTGTYGHPEPTQARVSAVKGKAILVSGHDLKDLEALLKQTEGKGINVYTHGEMLPALAYPGLKKHRHLVGNYGGAWQDQRREFAQFPGAILMTTNCIQNPQGYTGRIFTSGLVGWPGVRHIADQNFAPVIESSLQSPGFTQDEPAKFITVGFGRNAVLGAADKVISAVKAGKIRRFFLIGGCDGAKPGRNYYTELAESLPKDCVILTLACGKFRFNKLDFGDIGGIPRLLDMGQCNDAYSAIQVALALANAFKCGVNELPLSLVLSWYEQKAVAILLTLLHLGIKDIRLGPSLPAFVGPEVLKVLSQSFGLKAITTPEKDLEAMLGPVKA